MIRNRKKISLLISLVLLLTTCTSCANISDPSFAVIQYFQCLQKGDCQAASRFTESGKALPNQYKNNQVLSLIIPESTIRRPTTVQKDKDSAVIKVKLIVPDLNATLDYRNEDPLNAWDEDAVKEVFSAINMKNMFYETIEAQVTLVKKAGEWKVSDKDNKLFEKILLTYTQNNV